MTGPEPSNSEPPKPSTPSGDGAPARGEPDRAAAHRVFVEAFDADAGAGADSSTRPILVKGDEAHHAVRVKRLRQGEPVEVFDGRGVVLAARVAGVSGPRANPVLELQPAGEPRVVGPVSPRVEVCAPVPKGDRAEWMVDQLSQAGAAAWRPLVTARSEGALTDKRVAKLGRVALESAKQCGRAHLLEIGAGIAFDDALDHPACVIAAAGGRGDAIGGKPAEIRVLIGPEGGWTEAELHAARGRDVGLWALAPHVLRVETAAVLAAARALGAREGPA